MKKLCLYALVAAVALLAGCSGERPENNKPVVFVSIQPQQFFVERIAGAVADIRVLVPPGRGPHNYEPTPLQMAALAEAELYFTMGISFEKGFLHKIAESNPGLRIIPMDRGVEKRHMEAHGDHHDDEHGDHEHGGGLDPHIWLDPVLMGKQATVICAELSKIFPDKEKEFEKNLERLSADLESLNRDLQRKLAPYEGREFYVFHPSFGYFADRYGLKQHAVEIEGKEPSAKQVAHLVEQARGENVKVIFVQPQFADASARRIAGEIGGVVVAIDPLSGDYIFNMKDMASKIVEGYVREQGNGE